MKYKAIFLIFLSVFICVSFNFVFATESLDNSMENLSNAHMDEIVLNNDLDLSLNSPNDFNTNVGGNNYLESSSDSKVIYVGSNDNEGDGSYDNPFTTFKAACDSVNGENNVTINVFSGTYYLGEGLESDLSSPLKFNTNNLNIVGNGSVIIKNYYNDDEALNAEAFSLTSSSAKFNFSNLIFDATESQVTVYVDSKNEEYNYFMPFFGETDLGIFENCSFIGFANKAGKSMSGLDYNSKFINCYFECGSTGLFDNEGLSRGTWGYVIDKFTLFENCTFNIPNSNANSFTRFSSDLPWNISICNVWFGQNNIPDWMYPVVQWPSETTRADFIIPVNRYAIFNVTQNYLDDNQYEILGKLTWNGTDDQEGMENFRPMSVTLKSTTGDINQTATLVNGNFRAIYTSSATNHKVTAKLHNEEIELEFTNVNITANPINIYYGEDQNITFNFTQPITANVTVTVSNGSYNKSERVEIIDKDSLIYTVQDTLKEGTYDVEINLAENNLFGFNTTTLTVSKVSDYTFDVVAGDVKVGENATISITLPEDVNGTVIVKFGNDTKELSANQTMTVNFTNLNATTYSVNISYSGNDKYVPLDKPTSVTVNKADSSLEIENEAFTYGDIIAIPFNVTNANGVTVSVLNKDDDEVATASSESGTINLDTLPAGEYTLEATTIVGSNYEWVSKTIDLTINKANSTLDIQDKEFAYTAEAIINTVTENSTGDVIATLTDENNTEIAVTVSGDDITLPKLNTGKYTLTVTTNPDENHNNVTKTATITINKAAPSMNVTVEPVENITTKDDVKLTISLPSDATGEVTVKINGKKTDIKSANETIAIDLNNQAGDYVVDVTYSGDKNYESDMTTKEYTVSKAETLITAKQIDFEEGNASKIEVTVPDVESGIVLVDVAGKKFYGDIESGKATITLEGVSEGNYTANIKFFGDDKYNQATTTTDVKVSEDKIITELKEQLEEANAKVDNLTGELSNATDKIADLTAELNETQANATKLSEDLADAQANVTKLSDDLTDANAKVDNLTGELSNATDKIADLTAELNETQANATKLSEDLADAQANATKLSDDLTDANAKVDNLTAELNETQANATKLSEDLADANQKVNNLTTQLEKAQSNVTIVVDGVEYPVDVVNGTATIKTNSTPSNTTIDLLDTKFNVTEGQSIGTYAVDYPAGERGKTFQFQLTDANGNPIKNATVQFAYKTVIFNRTTDENGIVILGVSTQFADSYLCALSYLGDETHKAAFVAFNFKLDKKQITITAKAKTFKSTLKTKKYTITLKTKAHASKDGKTYLKAGKKVTLKINGKTYTAKINSKGKATFKITKLTKKGKFTATVKFTGDKTYKAATKKVKITIK